jgi:hypothetical protein
VRSAERITKGAVREAHPPGRAREADLVAAGLLGVEGEPDHLDVDFVTGTAQAPHTLATGDH